MSRKLTIITMGMVFALLFVCLIVSYKVMDMTSPQITLLVKDDEIVYHSDDDQNSLLQYATAVDDRDGDVTDKIIIDQIYYISDYTRAKVIYAVRDSSNHITKSGLIVRFDASEETIKELKSKRITYNTQLDVETDEQSQDKQSTDTVSDADQSNVQEKSSSYTKELTSSPVSPVVNMKTDSATINVGDKFNITDYIENISDDKDTKAALLKTVAIKGNYDRKVKGVYDITVYCTDSDGNESNHVSFTLNVE